MASRKRTPELTDGAAFDERCRRTMTVDIDEGKAFRKIILYVSASTLARGRSYPVVASGRP